MIRTLIFAFIMLVSLCECDSSTTIVSGENPIIDIYVVNDEKKIGLQEFLYKCPDEISDKPDDSTATKHLKKATRKKYHIELMKKSSIYMEFTLKDSYIDRIDFDKADKNNVILSIPERISYYYNGDYGEFKISCYQSSSDVLISPSYGTTEITFPKISDTEVKNVFAKGNKIRIIGKITSATAHDKEMPIEIDSAKFQVLNNVK